MQNATTEANSAPTSDVASVTNNVANCKLSTTPSDKPASTDTAAVPAAETPAASGGGGGGGGGSFAGTFKAFSKFGDIKSDGKHITLSQSDKWMKQAKVIDGKKITTTDTGIYFKKQKSMKLSMEQYKAFLDELAKAKKVELTEIKNKLANSGAPGLSLGPGGATSSAGKSPSAVERLTDVSKYTGSHKQRFDETGKGKGIAGRKDLPDASGYVQGYQNKDTYKAH